jgi:hypothetical protein
VTDPHGPSVPDLVLERSRLGELPASEQDPLRQRLEADPELRARLEALERSDAELRRRLHDAFLATRVRERLPERRPGSSAPVPRGGWWRAWPLPAGLAVVATVAVVLFLRPLAPAPRLDVPSGDPAAPTPSAPWMSPDAPASPVSPASSIGRAPSATRSTSPGSEPGVRTKGLRPALSLFRKTADGSETLADGDVAREGDVIRIGYRALGRRYGVIISLDGRGGVTRHLPEHGATAAVLEPSAVVLLAHAYQLDDAPAWERFFFVTADAPFPVTAVEDAAHRLAGEPRTAGPAAGLPLPKALEQSAILLMKERRP